MLPDDILQTKTIIHETFSDFSKTTCVILILVPKSLENVAKQCNFYLQDVQASKHSKRQKRRSLLRAIRQSGSPQDFKQASEGTASQSLHFAQEQIQLLQQWKQFQEKLN